MLFLREFQHQSVIRQFHAIGQFGVSLVVLEIMRYVRKVGLDRFELVDDFQGLGDVEVGGVFLVAQCVKDEHVEPVEAGHGLRRDAIGVGDVGKTTYAEGDYRGAAVVDGEWLDVEATYVEGAGDGN